ncbi:SDR family NAD(P)-dependent oxidoreductase [Siccirubricoccus sp. G192]|nr:SDR family NAD(P)-dependent oxidoreductase [Siccirubricoccus sp. G192]
MARYDGKLIVVTGAAGGIGRATIPILAAEGARLLLVDVARGPLEEIAAALPAGQAVAHESDPGSLAACRAALEAAPGPIHGLVHLAGIFVPHELDDAAPAIYQRTLAANATNGFDLAIAAAPRAGQPHRLRQFPGLPPRLAGPYRLFHGEGRAGRADPQPVAPAGAGEGAGERPLPRRHRDADARPCHRRAGRGLSRQRAARPLRPAGGGGVGDRVPALPGLFLHNRAVDQRGWRHDQRLSAAGQGCNPPAPWPF